MHELAQNLFYFNFISLFHDKKQINKKNPPKTKTHNDVVSPCLWLVHSNYDSEYESKIPFGNGVAIKEVLIMTQKYKAWISLVHKILQNKVLQTYFLEKLFTIQMEFNTENLAFYNLGRGKQIIPQTIKTFCDHGGVVIISNRESAVIQLWPLYCYLFNLNSAHIPGWWAAAYSE